MELKIPLKLSKGIQRSHISHILRAISKRTAELAQDLEIIQNTVCPRCGDKLKVKRATVGNMVFACCPRCAYSGFHKAEYFPACGGLVEISNVVACISDEGILRDGIRNAE